MIHGPINIRLCQFSLKILQNIKYTFWKKHRVFNVQKMVFLQRVVCLINSALIAEREREREREEHKISNISERI